MQSYERLEEELVKWTGMPYVVACSSGTAALHLAFEVLGGGGIKRQLVAMADFNMVACPRAARMANLWPLLVDCKDDLTVDEIDLGDAVGKFYDLLGGCLITHIYGRRSYPPINVNRYVIEDMAELHGTKPSLSTDATCWSFYKNKVVAGEEGGAVGFRLKEHADLARRLRSLGFTDDHDFMHVPRGHNYRLSNVHADLIRRSLDQFEDSVKARRRTEEVYQELIPERLHMPPRLSPWVYDLRIRGMTSEYQTGLVKNLRALGVEARHAFKPMHVQPEFKGCTVMGEGKNAEVLSREVLYLPLSGVRYSDQVRAAAEVVHFCKVNGL